MPPRIHEIATASNNFGFLNVVAGSPNIDRLRIQLNKRFIIWRLDVLKCLAQTGETAWAHFSWNFIDDKDIS
jgi:hypothetical protein